MRIALLQSNYIPWKGYFDLIHSADQLVIYDTRQYTKNDWRNRNQILLNGELTWLTVPIKASGRFGQRIQDAEVADRRWALKHWKSVSQAYSRHPYYEQYSDTWNEAWRHAADLCNLSQLNLHFLRMLLSQLGISTPVVRDADLACGHELLSDGVADPSALVLKICVELGASQYITGPAGLAYLKYDDFREAGVDVVVADYSSYPPYPQPGREDTVHQVSVLDLLANVGPEAHQHLRGRSWA